MPLKDLELKASYDSDEDDILRDFYIPALSESIVYKRIAGFFTSTSLAIAAKGLAKFILNNGKMQLITNVILSKEDYEKIKEVTEKPFLEKVEKEFIESLENIENELIKNHVKMLGWMLKNNKLEMKISLVSEGTGIQHQKTGILEDKEGNIISFSGSDNETKSGWLDNIENFHVFCNWKENDKEHIDSDLKRFEKFWNDEGKRSRVFPVSEAVNKELIRIAPENDKESEKLSDKITQKMLEENKNERSEIESTLILDPKEEKLILRDYQEKAIEKWGDNNYRGIYEMATGTGKTLTAIGSIKHLLSDLRELVVIVSCPYTHLVQQWRDDILKFLPDFEVVIADSSNSRWKNQLTDNIYDLKNQVIDKLLILTTHNTFFSDIFVSKITNIQKPVLLVCDEVHGIGSDQRREGLLDDVYTYRLGLSATPSRWFDDEGTEIIQNFFSKTVYEFTLKQAINTINPDTKKPYLVKYDYYPIFISLDEYEMNEYEEQTKKIAKSFFISQNSLEKRELFNLLCIKRQKIITNSRNKYGSFENILKKMMPIKHCLVYVSPEQIENVQNIISSNNIKQHKFTCEEGTKSSLDYDGLSEREFLLKEFEGGNYEILVAMKCLDEGVNVRQAKTAILLANSNNPREYIQRRGRTLRPYPGKDKAFIYDFIVVPLLDRINIKGLKDIELKIFQKEMRRFKEFADSADNQVDCLKTIIDFEKKYYGGENGGI